MKESYLKQLDVVEGEEFSDQITWIYPCQITNYSQLQPELPVVYQKDHNRILK